MTIHRNFARPQALTRTVALSPQARLLRAGISALALAALALAALPGALHAETLEFAHPVTGEPGRASAPVPADMLGLLRVLREDSRAFEANQRR